MAVTIRIIEGSRLLLDEQRPTTTQTTKVINDQPAYYYGYGKSANGRRIKSKNHKSANQTPQSNNPTPINIPASAEIRGVQGYAANTGGYNNNRRGGSGKGINKGNGRQDVDNRGRDDRDYGNRDAGVYAANGNTRSGDRRRGQKFENGRRGYRDDGYAGNAGGYRSGNQKSKGRRRQRNNYGGGYNNYGYSNYGYQYPDYYFNQDDGNNGGGYAAQYGNYGWDRTTSRDRRGNNGNNNYGAGRTKSKDGNRRDWRQN